MEPLGYIPRYESMPILAEIDVRGRFMTMSVDVEWTLLNIMAYLSPDPLNQSRKFSHMAMHNKIECTICDVKKYKPVLYEEYRDALSELWDFKAIRNDMAHHRMRFEEGDTPSYLDVIFVDDAGGMDQLHTKRYLIADVVEAVRKFRKLNMKLLGLQKKIQDDFWMNNQIKKQLE